MGRISASANLGDRRQLTREGASYLHWSCTLLHYMLHWDLWTQQNEPLLLLPGKVDFYIRLSSNVGAVEGVLCFEYRAVLKMCSLHQQVNLFPRVLMRLEDVLYLDRGTNRQAWLIFDQVV